MSRRPFNVLFICTGNSARSVLAEAALEKLGAGRFKAFSAGSMPAGRVNPFTLEVLRRHGYPVESLRSKSWEEFSLPGAAEMDAIITVCDNAAGEACPIWPGRPATAHWGFEDPAAFSGPDEAKRARFEAIYQRIYARMQQFAALAVEQLDARALREKLGSLEHDTA